MLLTTPLAAQEHSIEITTGYPSIAFSSEFPNSFYRSFDGIRQTNHFQHGINIGYTYAWRPRWEVNAMMNLHLTWYDSARYPEITNAPTDDGKGYDWDTEPLWTERSVNIYGSACASVRYKWIARERYSLYSGLGIGFSHGLYLNDFPCPLPYVAPIGIQFGKGKVYGIVEANVSPATTFGMAGIGVRL